MPPGRVARCLRPACETLVLDRVCAQASGPVGTADQLMVGTCTDVNSGDTVTPTASGCFNFLFSGQDDFTATINTAGVSNLFIFAQHVPTEFERDTHYLLDMADTDIEPVASVGAPAGHDHRRLSQAVETPAGRRRLGSLGSCCNNDHQIGAFRQIVAYHDLCDHDDIPMYVEVGLHDYEASCEVGPSRVTRGPAGIGGRRQPEAGHPASLCVACGHTCPLALLLPYSVHSRSERPASAPLPTLVTHWSPLLPS